MVLVEVGPVQHRKDVSYTANTGVLSLSSGSPSYSPETRTLTCISTGGPVTSVTWKKGSMSLPLSSTIYLQSQRVVQDTASSIYHNLLFINSNEIRDFNDMYSCRVSNSRGDSVRQTVVKRKFKKKKKKKISIVSDCYS